MAETRSYSYSIVTPSANLPIVLTDLKAHLKILATDTSQDTYLTAIIYAVVGFAEKYTKRTLLETTFSTYRDDFNSIIKLRRSRFISLTTFQYYVSSVLQTVPSTLYYTTDESDFSKIILKSDSAYPEDIDDRLDAIKIVFKAGYGATNASIPRDLYMALLHHAARLYENRGDCDSTLNEELAFKSDTDVITKHLPSLSKAVYGLYRIEDMFGDGYH
jgi:uncharacterized phiE125 gp8 family phage protein